MRDGDDPVPVDVQLTRWGEDDDEETPPAAVVDAMDPCPRCGRPYADHGSVPGKRGEEDWRFTTDCDGEAVRYLA